MSSPWLLLSPGEDMVDTVVDTEVEDMVVTEEVTVTTEVDMGLTEEVMVTTEVDMVVTANTAGKWKPEANKATELKELETKVLEAKEPTVNKISQVIANVFLNCFILDKNEIILLQFDFKPKNCSFAFFFVFVQILLC